MGGNTRPVRRAGRDRKASAERLCDSGGQELGMTCQPAQPVLTPELVQSADYVFGMTHSHVDTVSAVSAGGEKTFLLREFDETLDTLKKDISDPIGGSVQALFELPGSGSGRGSPRCCVSSSKAAGTRGRRRRGAGRVGSPGHRPCRFRVKGGVEEISGVARRTAFARTRNRLAEVADYPDFAQAVAAPGRGATRQAWGSCFARPAWG